MIFQGVRCDEPGCPSCFLGTARERRAAGWRRIDGRDRCPACRVRIGTRRGRFSRKPSPPAVPPVPRRRNAGYGRGAWDRAAEAIDRDIARGRAAHGMDAERRRQAVAAILE